MGCPLAVTMIFLKIPYFIVNVTNNLAQTYVPMYRREHGKTIYTAWQGYKNVKKLLITPKIV